MKIAKAYQDSQACVFHGKKKEGLFVRSGVQRSVRSRVARYPIHRFSSIEFRINIVTGFRLGRVRLERVSRNSPKVGNSCARWRRKILGTPGEALLPLSLSSRVPFAAGFRRGAAACVSFAAENACRYCSAKHQPLGELAFEFFPISIPKVHPF